MIPAPPANAPRCTAPTHSRFEDITQDGRMVLEALPNALGPAVWRGLLASESSTRACIANGIVPILSRYVIEGTPGPFSANAPLEAEGTFRLARAGDRLVVDMWADTWGPIGRTYGSADRQGEKALAGRVYAEHVMTRPFAPAGERRVSKLDFEGAPEVTGSREPLAPPESLAAVPEGATPLEQAMRADDAPIVFGLCHTDSNQHVNSLVYLRVFEEAALRRFARIGRDARVLGRAMEIAYRKPSFAGEPLRVALRAFEQGDKLGVAAMLVADAEAADLGRARVRVYARVTFET